jgi:hypothetical protein
MLKGVLEASERSIQALIVSDGLKPRLGKWKGDVILDDYISRFHLSAKGISSCATKFTLLASAETDANALLSLEEEMAKFVESLASSFVDACDVGVSTPLFELMFHSTQEVFDRLKDLIKILNENKESPSGGDDKANRTAPVATGMVWKACEDVEKVPKTNKAAYRRIMMQTVKTLNETVIEFSEYVEEGQRALDGEEEDDSDGDCDYEINDMDLDDDEDDAQDRPYNATELVVAKRCRDLLTLMLKISKYGLKVASEMNDIASFGNEPLGMEWIGSFSQSMKAAKDTGVALGSELFPPFDLSKLEATYVICTTTAGLLASTCIDTATQQGYVSDEINALQEAVALLASTEMKWESVE